MQENERLALMVRRQILYVVGAQLIAPSSGFFQWNDAFALTGPFLKASRDDLSLEEPDDTIRVRIWRALATGREMSLAELSKLVGESRSDVRHHLGHVEKQAKTLASKSSEWRVRRGLSPDEYKARVQRRRGKGKRQETFVRLS